MREEIDSKEYGLEFGLITLKNFFNTDYLHYGYFSDDIPVDVYHLHLAQKKYSDKLISQIPPGVKTILDVGCGSGRFAHDLTEKGYQVDCVSPSKILTEHAKGLLNNSSTIYEKKFENFSSNNKYDLILFSESFQYIDMNIALSKAQSLLSSKGYILICDFFKTDPNNKSKLGGGHSYDIWEKTYAQFPIRNLYEEDITEYTAPTMDVVHTLSTKWLMPTWYLAKTLLTKRFPFVMKLIQWKFEKKINKIENKYSSSERNGEKFAQYKKYMLYLFQLNS